jgi:predicted DNA-binding transcriptional regulator AlpA
VSSERAIKRSSVAHALPPGVNALLTTGQVLAAIGRADPGWIRDSIARGEFPAPDSPEGEHPRWKTSTINDWIEMRYTRGKHLSTPKKR